MSESDQIHPVGCFVGAWPGSLKMVPAMAPCANVPVAGGKAGRLAHWRNGRIARRVATSIAGWLESR